MRQRMMMAVAAAVAVAGSASAQSIGPAMHPRVSAESYPSASVYGVRPAGGCESCGPAVKSHGYGLTGVGIGAGTAMPVGCACHAADKTFVFGSCRQFFNPGNTCGPGGYYGHGGGLFGHRDKEKCPPPIYGDGTPPPSSNCHGPFTYLNR